MKCYICAEKISKDNATPEGFARCDTCGWVAPVRVA